MRIINESYETISESDVDLVKGYLTKVTTIREDATPIDNVTKFAWEDDDYEEVQQYCLYSAAQELPATPQDDTDAMMVDLEYRMTLFELGIDGGET